ncbi:hypothetical protein [Streptomyces sp. NPDC021622]|uniref:hypothetical protein n=1 Tax=Streptomyces sp. NPDC021622 TaxID=3155013 RepID=UPI0033C96E51
MTADAPKDSTSTRKRHSSASRMRRGASSKQLPGAGESAAHDDDLGVDGELGRGHALDQGGGEVVQGKTARGAGLNAPATPL